MPYPHHASRRAFSLVNIAAVAVIIGSVTAIAGITGTLPAAFSSHKGEPAVSLSVVPIGLSVPAAATVESCRQCGVIETVRQVTVKGHPSALEAGAIVGSQFGQGNGRSGISLTGTGGGSYSSPQAEMVPRTMTTYRVVVRMDDGTARTIYQTAAPAQAVGDKVRVINGTLASGG